MMIVAGFVAGGSAAGAGPGLAVAKIEQAITSFPPAFFAAAQPTTALDMVVLLPGFALDKGDPVRGFGGAAGNVLIDGARPAAKGDGLDEILKRIPASSVLRIDLIRGGAPGVDMQGKTVIANVVRRTDTPGQLIVSASATRIYDGRAGFGVQAVASRRLGQTSLEGSLLVGKGYDDGAGDGPRIARDGQGVVIGQGPEESDGAAHNYKATGAIETPVAGGKLRLDGSLFSNPYDYTQDDSLIPAGRAFEHDHQRQETAEVGLRYDHGLGARASLQAFLLQQVGRNDYTADLSDSGTAITLIQSGSSAHYALRKSTGESIARATVKYDPGEALSFETGGEADFNWLQDHTLYIQDGAPVAIPAANVLVTEERGEAFATATWRVRPSLTLEAGLRAEGSRIASSGDVVQSKTLAYPKPRIVATWNADARDQLRLRFEREVGQLNFDDFASSTASLSNGGVHAGNPDLRPQTDWVVEASLDHRFWAGADITLTLRHYWLQDVIDRAPIFDPAGDYDAPGNIGPGVKDEAAVTFTVPTDRIGLARGVLTGVATWRSSRVIDPTTLAARPISGLHPLDGEVHFTQGLPKWKADWGFDIFNQWRETYYRFNEIDTDKLKTFVVLFAEYKPRPDLALRFEIQNAGARGFEHLRQVYGGPRNVSGLAFTDLRDLHFGREIYLRVRKNFG
ncbi:MAG TPA: TonB-dependent receptor [Caulobacteraceae bacterium]